MSDLVERLRTWRPFDGVELWPTMSEAADRIAQLEAQVEALAGALDMAAFRLQLLVDRMRPDEDGRTAKAHAQTFVDDAREALASVKGEPQ